MDHYSLLLAKAISGNQAQEGYALKSEGFARGSQDGVDVDSSSPYYHNNAKYFKTETESIYEQAVAVQESIPEEYSELSADVVSLKSEMAQVLVTEKKTSGSTIIVTDADEIYDIVLNGAETPLYDGLAVIDGTNIAVTSLNGQTETQNKFMVGNSQVDKAYGDDFTGSYLSTSTSTGEFLSGRATSKSIEITFLKTRCEYTLEAVNTYLASHPLIIWYKSDNFASAESFYPVLKATSSTAYRCIGTMSAIAPLDSGDSISFRTGNVYRSSSLASTVTVSENLSLIPDNSTVVSTGSMDEIVEVSTNSALLNKVDVDGWNEVIPKNTTFFDNVNYFDPSEVLFYTDRYVSQDGKISSPSDTVSSVVLPVKANTEYVLYIPDNNRGVVVENSSDVFVMGQTYTVLYYAGGNPNGFHFTTGNDAKFIFAYFYLGTYDYDTKKANIRLVEGSTISSDTNPVVKLENLPQNVVNYASPLSNANILIFGDSITSCCNLTINSSNETTAYAWRNPSNSYTDAGGNTVQFSMWAKILKESQAHGEIRNYAYSGASYITLTREEGNERQNLHYQIDVAMNDLDNPNDVFEVDDYVPQIVIFALGTNDHTPNDTYESAMSKTVYESDGKTINVDATISALDETKFCESARKAYMRIKRAFPMAQLYCVLPIQKSDNDTNLGTLHEYLKQMAQRYGCIIIDGAFDTGITRDFNVWDSLGTYLKDGLHPNEKGQNLLARAIIKSLLSHYIPFGDGFNQ